MAGKKKKKGCCGCFSGLFTLAFLLVIGAIAFVLWNKMNGKTFADKPDSHIEIFIPQQANFDQVVDSINAQAAIKDEQVFRWIAKLKKYPDLIKPGRFRIEKDWSHIETINALRSGNQAPVRLVINNARTMEDLAGIVSSYIQADSLGLIQAFRSEERATDFGFSKESFPSMFLADTYELYWNTGVDEFISRMKREYDAFWTDENKAAADALGLSEQQVITLASIVEEETKMRDEQRVVAGLYLNRLDKDWPLEADPTLKFAVGDFALQRVLNIHKEVDSPYNTYKYAGLPPGPIRIPEKDAINAVLNPASHEYMFMCAKADFSGYHAFARTLREHNANAEKYRQALNERGIFR